MNTDQSQPIAAIDHCSVKVMRSHDYCHFEVVLGSMSSTNADGEFNFLTTAQVDALRKEAARLADKAVEQYKIAKRALEIRNYAPHERRNLVAQAEDILAKPESDWTPEEKAVVKKARDDAYWAARGHYDYEDDYDPDQDQDVEA